MVINDTLSLASICCDSRLSIVIILSLLKVKEMGVGGFGYQALCTFVSPFFSACEYVPFFSRKLV